MEGSADDSSTKCFIDHMGMSEFEPDYLADQYKRAADQLVSMQEEGGDVFQPDGLFMPIGYLYRHSIELKLKGLLSQLIECDLAEDVDGLLGKHKLIMLWDVIKPVLIAQWPNSDRKPLNNVEGLLHEFHRIDKTGQSLRYTSTTAGKDVREAFPKIIRLELLKGAFDEMYSLLDGCSMHFGEMVDHVRSSHGEW